VALVAVFAGKAHPFQHGAFIAGIALIAVGAVFFISLALERPKPPPVHQLDLRTC
jgi:hypothetical protein